MASRLNNSSERFDMVNPTLSPRCKITLKNVGQIFEIINMCLKGVRFPLQTYLVVAADRWRCLGDEALVFRVGIRATLCRRRGNDLSYKIQPFPIRIRTKSVNAFQMLFLMFYGLVFQLLRNFYFVRLVANFRCHQLVFHSLRARK